MSTFPGQDHLGDALPKLKALALYADEHGGEFERILSVGLEREGKLLAIDMIDAKTRKAVYESSADAESVKALYAAHGTEYAALD